MMQVIEQTRDEKVAMYMKLTKRELVEMLLNNRELVDRFTAPPTRSDPVRTTFTLFGDCGCPTGQCKFTACPRRQHFDASYTAPIVT